MTEYSYNNWPASRTPSAIGIVSFAPVLGRKFPGGVKGGDVAVVMTYVVKQFHKRVESIIPSVDEWGYSYRANRNNPATLSCHSSGTAIDINATKHPNGRGGTFTAAQVYQIHKILAEVDHCVRWGGDFHSTKDEMHFEIVVNAATLKKTANRLRIAPKPVPYKYTHLNLQLGSKNVDVGHLQHRLSPHYYSYVVDSDFGPHTKAAVQGFQKDHGLPITGVVNLATAQKVG